MSYKLKKYGKNGVPYLNILGEQVEKMGMTISEVIRKEHFDIAIQKVSIGNSITSIREISRINFLALFEEIKHYTTIENSNDNKGHALIGAKTVSSYFNSIKSLDIAVEKLQEKIAKQESCHICNPVVKNNKYKKKHMCSNCQKLVNLIIENVKESGGWTTQADIVYAIKQKGKEEETCQNTYEIRKLRYKNLRDYLTELNKDKKLNKKKIEDLVNTIFKEKDGFEKFSF